MKTKRTGSVNAKRTEDRLAKGLREVAFERGQEWARKIFVEAFLDGASDVLDGVGAATRDGNGDR